MTAPGAGERLERDNHTVVVVGEEPRLSAIEICFDPSFHVEPHSHDDLIDSFLVLEGEVEFTLGDDLVRAGPGMWLSAPPGVRHGFRAAGPRPAHFLTVHAPDAGFVSRIRSA